MLAEHEPHSHDASPSAPGALAVAWLEADGRARLIVDSDLRVLWMNRALGELLTLDPAIAIEGGRIARGEAYDRLRGMLGDASDKRECAVKFLRSEGHYLIRTISSQRGENRICMEIKAAHRDAKTKYFDLRAPFGLTATEANVALCLADGLTASEIAKVRNTSIETVRSHVRSVYVKLGISSRENLFSLLSQFQYI